MFFHFTWEGFKADTSVSTPTLVPTANQQNGIIPDHNGQLTLIDPEASTFSVNGNSYAGAGFSTCNITHANGNWSQ